MCYGCVLVEPGPRCRVEKTVYFQMGKQKITLWDKNLWQSTKSKITAYRKKVTKKTNRKSPSREKRDYKQTE